MVMTSVDRICQKGMVATHVIGAKILEQLKTNPEVCEGCDVKPCVFAVYLWGKERLKKINRK